jgi:serine protease
MKRVEQAWLPAIAVAGMFAQGCSSAGTCDTQANEFHGVMIPDNLDVEAWQAEHENLELRDSSAPPMAAQSVEASLDYDPVARNQGACGDCWMWASTMVLEVALNHERALTGEGDNVELSVQWGNSLSSETEMITKFAGSHNFQGPCCGGTMGLFADIYNASGDEIVPVGGDKTRFADGNQSASKGECRSSVAKSEIQETGAINVGNVVAFRLGTTGSAEATIAEIKHAIDSGEAVYMAMQLPHDEAWDGFRTMWVEGDAATLFNPTQFCGATYDSCSGGAGHALVIVGYADDGEDDSYWTVLNSWGAPVNHPDATYRMQMRGIDYGCSYPSGGGGGDIDALHFQGLSIP